MLQEKLIPQESTRECWTFTCQCGVSVAFGNIHCGAANVAANVAHLTWTGGRKEGNFDEDQMERSLPTSKLEEHICILRRGCLSFPHYGV